MNDNQAADELDRLISGLQKAEVVDEGSALDGEDEALARALFEAMASTHPNPAFVARLEARLAQRRSAIQGEASRLSQTGEGRRSFIPWRRQRLAAAVILLVLLGGALLLAPPTRAALQQFLFGLAFVELQEIETVAVAEPVVAPPHTEQWTLADVRSRAPFPVAAPTWLPADLAWSGGYVQQETTGATLATLTYRPLGEPSAPTAPLLVLMVADGDLPAPPLLPAAGGQWTNVDGQPAIFLQGGWQADSATPDSMLSGLSWQPGLDSAWLSWQAEGLTYWLHASDLSLDQEEMIRVAESLQ